MFPGLLAELELLHREKLSIRFVLFMGVLSIRKSIFIHANATHPSVKIENIPPITQHNQQVLTNRKSNGHLRYQTIENLIPI